jgi:hypothetical protein
VNSLFMNSVLRVMRPLGLLILVAGSFIAAQAQEPPAKPASISASARLAAAKTVFLKKAGGSDIPLNVITSDIEGWGRFTLVDSAEKADLVLEVLSPDENGNVTVTNSYGVAPGSTQPESSTRTSRELPGSEVKLTVYDPRSKVPLWSGHEKAKPAMKAKVREDNLVEAAERLFAAFRQRVEK